MNGIAIYFRQTKTTRYLVGLTLRTFYLISIEIDEFIDITSAVPSDFSDELDEFVETLMNEWK